MIFRNVPRSLLRVLGALFLCAAVVAGAVGCGAGAPEPVPPSGGVATPGWAEGMATVRASALPRQARDVLALIDKGGPYPYRQDGTVFGNFEKALPKQGRGYYHEFTVKTPGERDRGARRIVTGEGGEFYYTDDHYNTFKAVLR
ncbi:MULTISPECIES: ribonuclease domain-containing protein [unclassified Streptomyces]|uniref:ribonuclease domain-containing protein n=1 Tax=unclassified Streptomyces TaxID=2593676 RepID=UPI00224F1784|nr:MULTISPECIES: ribonuclease domain-containing protein [unclassified Streptomyces]MCX4524808.1 guanine-specific ribonuclease N1 and T1 [Streptomyces sp. NBC_01551]MCX4544681.1 guanine-specific ribonuclease N1 and T1 [Streptomyces sp. NBC_01565]